MEDYDLVSRLSLYGSVVNLPTICLHYRHHSNQITKLSGQYVLICSWLDRFLEKAIEDTTIAYGLSPVPFWFLLGPKREFLRKVAKKV